jgi:hypothetical protein
VSWLRVDDKSAFHAKVVRAGNEAWGACCRAGAWSADHGTDGVVPTEIATMIAKESVWKRAENAGGEGRVGLVERVANGIVLHDFLEWNPSAEQVEKARQELSEKRRAAGIAGNEKRWGEHRKTVALATPLLETRSSQNVAPIPSHPIPSKEEREEIPPKPPRKRGGQAKEDAPIPPDFVPDQSCIDSARRHGRDIEGVVESMRNWAESGNVRRSSWQATLRTFIAKAEQRGENPSRQDASPYHEITTPARAVTTKAILDAAPPEAQQALEQYFGGGHG